MDGSKSRKSDIAATRKRRSSILKSQRPPRTPFSEVEFNVATPPDAAKSRRVSFSRRNGVAEFEITEATTAWKNVYEEHNKSMESSVNESDGKQKQAGQRVGHLGSRLTDFQFQDAEAEMINTGSRDQLISSFTVDTFATTGDDKSISAPSRAFEFTEFTEQQTNQLFDNDANPLILETSDHIEVDFSAVAPIGNNNKVMDSVVQERKGNTSYVDIDLNCTHFSIKGEASISDMSITDTIHSPKVAASKSAVEEKKSNDSDWVADKENIVVNPYVAPKPAENFAVSDGVDDVLVFDGKKCKFQSNLSCITSSDPSASDVNQTDPKPHITEKWKTIVYGDDGDISMTKVLPSQVILPLSRAESRELADIVYDDDFHISMTQAVSSNVILSSQPETSTDKQKTVFFDDFGDITVTQALPSNILSQRVDVSRKSIVHECDDGNISLTQCIPSKIITNSETCGKTILFKDEDGDVSMTQAIPNVLAPKLGKQRKSVASENVDSHISMTEAITANIISETEASNKSILYKNEGGEISMTMAVPVNFLRARSSEPETRKTIVYENNAADISMTQTVNNVLLQEIKHENEIIKEDITNINACQVLPTTGDTNKRRTILFSSDQGDVSITQALPVNLIVTDPSVINNEKIFTKDVSKARSVDLANPEDSLNLTESTLDEDPLNVDRANVKMTSVRNSRDYSASNTQPDMSITEAIQLKNISSNNTSINDENLYNMSITKPIPTHMISIENKLDDDLIKYKTDGLNGGNYSAGLNQSETGVVVFDAAIKLDKLKEDPIDDPFSVNSRTIKEDPIEDTFSVNSRTIKEDPIEDTFSVNSKTIKDPIENTFSVNSKTIKEDPIEDTFSVTSKTIKEDPKEDTFSVNSNTSFPSKSSCEKKSEIMEEEEDENSSAESMIEVCSRSSSKDCDGDKVPAKMNPSILSDLLDMTNAGCAPYDAEADDNHFIIKSNSSSFNNIAETTNLKKSTESYLLIKDSDEEQGEQAPSKADIYTQGNQSSLSDNSKIMDGHIAVSTIRNKLGELRDYINRTTSPEQKPNDITSSARESIVQREEANTTMGSKMPINSNDTKAILDLLSQFTDDPVEKESDDIIASPLKVNHHMDMEYMVESYEPPRRSLVPDRKSMVRCREDLLKDISMAQAMMKYESDETEEAADDSASEAQTEPFAPSSGTSCGNEVVKHLKFDDDDSMLGSAAQQSGVYTPLKKTAFGETAYMQDQDYSKAKVIPGYLTDLPEELKQVMNDLTKPMVNDTPIVARPSNRPTKETVARPFNPPTNETKNSSSTCSTQIQANLIKSSQIDLAPEMLSCSPSHSQHQNLLAIKHAQAHPNGPENIYSPENSNPGVIVFDHRNPLNNILLPPIDAVETHRYSPRVSLENTARLDTSAHDAESRKNESKGNTESRVALYSPAPALAPGSPVLVALTDASGLRTPASVDQAVGAMLDLKDTEANTLIAMKPNRELLDTSSSLTLVDDTPSNCSLKPSSAHPSHKPVNTAVQVIYHVKELDSELKMDSDATSNDEDPAEVQLKAKKRFYSPQKIDKNLCPTEAGAVMLTPKPASKVQKVSSSPKTFKKVDWVATEDCTRSPFQTSPSVLTAETVREAASPDLRKGSIADTKHDHTKPGTDVIVQRLMDTYEYTTDQNTLTNQIMTAVNAKLAASSCTTHSMSDKHLAAESPGSDSRLNLHSDSEGMASEVANSTHSRSDWQPELIHEMSSKNLVAECDSDVDIVAKIDQLPFMGSADCEWECCGAEAWTFRLLRARLRLVVELDARRGRVCAATAVRAVRLEQPPLDRKENPIAALCVRFAAEATRYLAAQRWRRAGDVPALLRRAAGAARVAVRWGRAMHAARAHLAFSLADDGELSLKVANVQLRCVWEVSLRVELVVAGARGAPWPRAGAGRVARALPAGAPRPDLRRLLLAVPHDWGHAPRAVWKIFKYLKNLTLEDDLMIGIATNVVPAGGKVDVRQLL